LLQFIESIRRDYNDESLNWVDGVKHYNLDGDGDLESMRDFVSAESPFYPALKEVFRRREEEWYERKLEEQRVEPFLEDIAKVVADYWAVYPGWGTGPGRQLQHEWGLRFERYVRNHVAQYGELPTGIHSIEAPCLGNGRKAFDINFDTLAEQAQLRRNGKVIF
jgi:hypothetical protein